MNISPLKFFGINNTAQLNNASFFGLRLNNQPNNDSVSFSGKLKDSFQTKKDAVEYYKNIANSVNESLQEEDDVTAFETLGYNVDSDFETDKITINGDFKPYFKIYVKGQLQEPISYEDVGISQDDLLRNVEQITGEKHLSPSFVPDDDFKINPSTVYPEKLGKKLEKIVAKRMEEAKKALDEGDDKKALGILGYETETNEDGKITIKGDYDSTLLKYGNKTISINDYEVDENSLLRNVSNIEGSAKFLEDFSPNHYIEAQNYRYTDKDFGYHSETEKLKGKFLRQHPSFIEQKEEIQTALNNQDTLGALNLMGICASKNKDDKIEISGDFAFSFPLRIGENKTSIGFDEVGADKKEILRNIQKITGSLYYPDSVVPKLQGGMEIGGYVALGKRTNEESFFEEYISPKHIAELYEGIPEDAILNYAQNGVLEPSIKTRNNVYFNTIEGENKAFLDSIMERRDEILTSEELQEKYGVSKVSVDHALQGGTLKGYGLENTHCDRFARAKDFLFDITDERNKEGLLKLEKTGKQREIAKARASMVPANDFERACLKNSIRLSDQTSTFSFPASDLEKLGYGTKADLMANCGLRINSYEIKQFILNNDSYDINKPYIMDTLLTSRHNNPSIISLKALQKKLGENKDVFREAVVQDKLNIITENPYRLTYPEDYCIDLADEKNLAFFKSIQDENFQNWLSGIISAKEIYTKRNIEAMEAFMKSDAPTATERKESIKEELRQIEIERKKAESAKRLEIKERKLEHKRKLSLRNTIAWVLCPQTKQVKREHSNQKVQEIIAKNAELKEINEQLLAGEITLEEAKERIIGLNLSKSDEITMLSYHKTCWDISGTNEWKQALSDAKEIMKIYDEEGIDGIENPELKQRLIEWEADWANK